MSGFWRNGLPFGSPLFAARKKLLVAGVAFEPHSGRFQLGSALLGGSFIPGGTTQTKRKETSREATRPCCELWNGAHSHGALATSSIRMYSDWGCNELNHEGSLSKPVTRLHLPLRLLHNLFRAHRFRGKTSESQRSFTGSNSCFRFWNCLRTRTLGKEGKEVLEFEEKKHMHADNRNEDPKKCSASPVKWDNPWGIQFLFQVVDIWRWLKEKVPQKGTLVNGNTPIWPWVKTPYPQ